MITFAHLALLLYGVGYGVFIGVSIEQGQISKNGWLPVVLVNLLWPLIFMLSVLTATTDGGDPL